MTDTNVTEFESQMGSLTDKAVLKETLDDVAAWLGRLVLLYGVPFHYLVPEEEMLPIRDKDNNEQGSLRFFYVDPVWIQCLVQGACSIGNTEYGNTIIDKALNQWVQPNQPVGETAPGAADQNAASVRDRLRREHEGVEHPEGDPCLNWPLTGFLLRSPVVEGWRGLEIHAYKELTDEEENKPPENASDEEKNKFKDKCKEVPRLKPLRIEQLSKDVLLGIFNGKIAELVIRQPREGLHFGLTRLGGQSYQKTLRKLGGKGVGQTLTDDAKKPLVVELNEDNGLLRKQDQKGVIRIAEIAKKIQERLGVEAILADYKIAKAAQAMKEILGRKGKEADGKIAADAGAKTKQLLGQKDKLTDDRIRQAATEMIKTLGRKGDQPDKATIDQAVKAVKQLLDQRASTTDNEWVARATQTMKEILGRKGELTDDKIVKDAAAEMNEKFAGRHVLTDDPKVTLRQKLHSEGMLTGDKEIDEAIIGVLSHEMTIPDDGILFKHFGIKEGKVVRPYNDPLGFIVAEALNAIMRELETKGISLTNGRMHIKVTRALSRGFEIMCEPKEVGKRQMMWEVGKYMAKDSLTDDFAAILLRIARRKGEQTDANTIAAASARLRDVLFKFTSAEFAVEMIEAPGEFTYQLNRKSST